MAHEDNHPFAHLSSDLAQEEEILEIDDEEIADENLVVPVVDDLEAPPPLPLLSSMPTQIVRAHKVLDRARMKRAERIEEGRTLIIDHDKPPAPPPKVGGSWSWITIVVLILAFGSVMSMILYQMTQNDVIEESIAIDGVIEEALPEEPPPPPPIKQAIVVEEQKIELPPEPPPLEQKAPLQQKAALQQKAPVREQKTAQRKAPAREQAAPVREPGEGSSLPGAAGEETITPSPVVVEPPVPQTSIPETGFVEIVTLIGAKIEIDSREAGTAPVQKIELQPGRHAIWVTLSGHEVFQKDVLVKRGETTVLDAKLTPIAPTAP